MKQILAAIIFFTRLPFGRCVVPVEYFKHVVPYWPLTGWITSAVSVLVLFVAALVFPTNVAVLLAILTRVLVSGCLHEDGLSDFFDGFGGGTSRERTLVIMKDSHIGVYGVVGLLFYFGLLYLLLCQLPVELAGYALLAADPYAKGLAAMVINHLPYARKEEESKTGTSYRMMNATEWVLCICFGLLPLFWLPSPVYLLAALLPIPVWFFLVTLMKRKIQGYTGDCCGALFLLCELSFYLAMVAIYHQM